MKIYSLSFSVTQICIHPLVAPSSRLFRNFPKDLLRSLASENITANFHSWSLSMQVISASSFFSFLPVIGEVFVLFIFSETFKMFIIYQSVNGSRTGCKGSVFFPCFFLFLFFLGGFSFKIQSHKYHRT